MALPSAPYRDSKQAALAKASGAMAPIPRPISRGEATAWRAVAVGPPALAVYLALASLTGCFSLGGAPSLLILAGMLWGVTAYGIAFETRRWIHRAWPELRDATSRGDLEEAEVRLRRFCASTRMYPHFHAACLRTLSDVAMRRGELQVAEENLQIVLATPWLVGNERATGMYMLAEVRAWRGRPAEGRLALAAADALAPKTMRPVSAMLGAQIAIAEGDFEKAVAELQAGSRLEGWSRSKVSEALWAYALHKASAPPEEVRLHTAAAAGVSRVYVTPYLRAWPDLAEFLEAHGVTLEA